MACLVIPPEGRPSAESDRPANDGISLKPGNRVAEPDIELIGMLIRGIKKELTNANSKMYRLVRKKVSFLNSRK